MKILFLHIGVTIVIILAILLIAFNFRGFQKIIDFKYIKYLLVGVIVMIYLIMSFVVDLNKAKKYDFFYGILIGIVSISVFLISRYYIGIRFPNIHLAPKEGWILLDIFTYPIGFCMNLVGIKSDAINIVLASFIPTILIGIGIKCRRIAS
ncbi:MAG: hypothetical protein N4A76_01185 [Firmicutes bacterium]|jgi:hypothetical protein|nr:hypothetical protein [Bacillota bacterium]